MNRRPTHATAAGRVYLALQKKARTERRLTDELLQLHALEAFVDRIASSPHVNDLVLKGGVLLSAYNLRRPTRDVDLSARNFSRDPAHVQTVIDVIAKQRREDGWTFVTRNAQTIREGEVYNGVRVAVGGTLASAKQEFHVDVSFGDPIVPGAEQVSLARLLGGELLVRGYPLSMVLAEKLVTALQRGTRNTRWRDYADVVLLSRLHSVREVELRRSLTSVPEAREIALSPLAPQLARYAEFAQTQWAAWVRRQSLAERLPLAFDDVLQAVCAFADPVLGSSSGDRGWDPTHLAWR